MRILEELENIDDDTDRHGIHFVKTQDLNIATNFGVTDFPAVIYFENQVPSIYEGKAKRFKKSKIVQKDVIIQNVGNQWFPVIIA